MSIGRPRDYTGNWALLIEAVGGQPATLAKILLRSERSLQRYAKGDVVPDVHLMRAINDLARRYKIGPIYKVGT